MGTMGFDGALAGRGTPSSFALSARFRPPVNCVLASVSALSLRIASALACCAASAALSGAQAPVLRRANAAARLLFSLGHCGEIWEARDEMGREWKRCLVLVALGMWICGAWVYIGGRTTAAINISLICSIAPVLIVSPQGCGLRSA